MITPVFHWLHKRHRQPKQAIDNKVLQKNDGKDNDYRRNIDTAETEGESGADRI